MGTLQLSAAGIPLFIAYFGLGIALTALFILIYTRITGHDEIALIRQHNATAGLALGGSVIGFAIPLAKAMAQAATVLDCMLWGGVALLAQLLIYGLARLLIPGLTANIENNAMASGWLLASLSIAGGLLNAAAMTIPPGG